eukprot:Awhi_evm1s10412
MKYININATVSCLAYKPLVISYVVGLYVETDISYLSLKIFLMTFSFCLDNCVTSFCLYRMTGGKTGTTRTSPGSSCRHENSKRGTLNWLASYTSGRSKRAARHNIEDGIDTIVSLPEYDSKNEGFDSANSKTRVSRMCTPSSLLVIETVNRSMGSNEQYQSSIQNDKTRNTIYDGAHADRDASLPKKQKTNDSNP